MTTTETKTALVLGATGGIGGEAADALARHGWRVRGLARKPQPVGGDIEWRRGDAMNAADVAAAAQGAQLIVHAVNPPGYRDWDTLVLPMLDNAIAAAKAQGARIVLPGTLYNYGPDAFPLVREASPQTPDSRKGRIRVQMEQRLEAASRAGAKALIVRAGDFFGPRNANNWFGQGVVKPGGPLKSITEPVRGAATHAWAYLPDLAETMALLADREADLAALESFNFAGFQLARGEMGRSIRAVVGDPRLPIRGFPWSVVLALSPVVRMFREVAEVRHLWSQTVAMDGSRLKAFLGDAMPSTPLDEAVRRTLTGLGVPVAA